MITKLQIQNFRGLRNVSLDGLRRVNLLVGGNDTGKTSVLEALLLLLGDSGQVSELPASFRNNQSGGSPQNTADDRENYWFWLFYDRNTVNKIEIIAKIDNNSDLRLSTEFVPEGSYQNAPKIPMLVRSVKGQSEGVLQFNNNDVRAQGGMLQKEFKLSRLSVRPSHPVLDAEKYNQIALERNGEVQFEQIMREVEPRLKRLRYAKLPNTTSPLVFVDLGLSRAVPATQMGQAFNRILHIYAEILTAKTNILLIDEIENGIFSESLPLIWKGLFAVCEQQNVQIFATTHSRECVMAAHQADEERRKDELSIQRLQIVRGNIEAVRLGAQELEVASKMGLEVRS